MVTALDWSYAETVSSMKRLAGTAYAAEVPGGDLENRTS